MILKKISKNKQIIYLFTCFLIQFILSDNLSTSSLPFTEARQGFGKILCVSPLRDHKKETLALRFAVAATQRQRSRKAAKATPVPAIFSRQGKGASSIRLSASFSHHRSFY